MKYCTHCGTQLVEGQAYCHNCGAKVEQNIDQQSSSYNSQVDDFFADFQTTKQQNYYQKVDTYGTFTNSQEQSDSQEHFRKSGFSIAAQVLMILTCVGYGILVMIVALVTLLTGDLMTTAEVVIVPILASLIYLLPLAWVIPMTVVYTKSIKKGKDVSIAFKICTLLFVSLIAGVLMLCDTRGDYKINN